jgi:hypothetical protein
MKCEEILADMFVVSCLLSVRDIPIFEAILMLHSKQMSYLAARSSADVVYCSDIRSAGLLDTDRTMRVHSMARSQL